MNQYIIDINMNHAYEYLCPEIVDSLTLKRMVVEDTSIERVKYNLKEAILLAANGKHDVLFYGIKLDSSIVYTLTRVVYEQDETGNLQDVVKEIVWSRIRIYKMEDKIAQAYGARPEVPRLPLYRAEDVPEGFEFRDTLNSNGTLFDDNI